MLGWIMILGLLLIPFMMTGSMGKDDKNKDNK